MTDKVQGRLYKGSFFDPNEKLLSIDGHFHRKDLAPGLFYWIPWYHKPDVIACMDYICPCGCGALGFIRVDITHGDKPCWNWDGNKEAPTLNPSIQRTVGCKWHGYLEQGFWRRV